MRRALLCASALGAILALAGCSLSSSDEPYVVEGCERRALAGRSVARLWDEALLNAIRRDTPAPTVHARNLFHTSAAMWDAWAAYDPGAEGYFVKEMHRGEDVQTARETAISYAAYRLLLHRYSYASGLQETFDELTATMASLCLRSDYVGTDGDSPAALGNRIAAAAIAHGRDDGAGEELRYADPTYTPANPPLVVAEAGAEMRDPNRWQPLALARLVAQNGTPIPGSVQTFIGPHWGDVAGFALPPSRDGLTIDPGPLPRLGDPAFARMALEVIRYSSRLGAEEGGTIDVGPGSQGGNTLARNDGRGHERNPVTGEPYAPNLVLPGDFGRVLAEYWADGPRSETPPGHWNAIANEVSDSPEVEHRIGGAGREVDRLEWDVKLYFTLNGAVHDAAVAAWGTKGHYDSARPISMIRYLGGLGQSSDPDGPAYDPQGLPLEDGLVEVVTVGSSAPGERHEHLADHVGEVAIRAWRGFPDDPETERSGVGWILAVDWVPYQRSTFVSPAFAGYVSGHSAFSRAAAEVLTAFTGGEYFPGGMHEHAVGAGELIHEEGPDEPITLQWATYRDAADQAGISRLFIGIHIAADDLAGRRIGAACGKEAWALATEYFAGTAHE